MNITIHYDNLVKLLILGDTSVGKSNLMLVYTGDDFMENYITTLGFDFKTKVINLEGGDQSKNVKLQIWDTSGQERYMAITKNLYSKVQGIVLVFDVTELSTFANIEKWLSTLKDNGDFPVVLVGNKIDLENRVVSYDQAKSLADKYHLSYFETSARDNVNVNEPFEFITKIVIECSEKNKQSSVKLKKIESRLGDNKNGCC